MKTIITSIFILFFITNSFAQHSNDNLKITHLFGDFYIYETYSVYKGNRIPANSMYMLTDKGAVLFDSPWDSTQFQPLLDSIMLRHHQKVIMCIATHFHDDRSGGLEYYKQHGIKTYSTKLTDSFSKKNGKMRAEFLISNDTVFTIGQYSFQTYYPGPGHTADNIVIWFEKEKALVRRLFDKRRRRYRPWLFR